MKMCHPARCLCAISLCALVAGCSDLFIAKNHFDNNRAWTNSQQARIVAAGDVVDVSGHPLEGVRVTANHVYLRPTFDDLPRADTIREKRSEQVNGRFRMVFSWADEVEIRFSKPGYRDVVIDLDVEAQPGGDDSLGRYPKAKPVLAEDLKIVMRPLPPPPQTTSIEANAAGR
jgi:hypothetical protein